MPLPARIGRLRLPVLCFIVSPAAMKDSEIDKVVAEAVAGGVAMVQLRDREMPGGELLDLARRLKRVVRGKALLIINDRIDLAIAADADGIQLPENGLPTLVSRGLIGKYAVIGRSVHSPDAASQAGREGADFVIAGTIYKSPSKPEVKPAGLSLITEIVKSTTLPVMAVGGVTAERVGDVVKAGAAGVAVISAIAKAEDPKSAAEGLATALKEAWTARAEKLSASA